MRRTAGQVRGRGAVIAISLGLVWLFIAGGAKSTFDYLLQTLIYGLPFYLLVILVVIVLIFVMNGAAADGHEGKREPSSTAPEGGPRGSDAPRR
jgi:hypothetical protein